MGAASATARPAGRPSPARRNCASSSHAMTWTGSAACATSPGPGSSTTPATRGPSCPTTTSPACARKPKSLAADAVAAYEQAPEEEKSFGDEAGSRTDLAVARARSGNLEGASEAIQPVLDLPVAQRIHGVVTSVLNVHRAVTTLAADAPLARDIQEEIENLLPDSRGGAAPLAAEASTCTRSSSGSVVMLRELTDADPPHSTRSTATRRRPGTSASSREPPSKSRASSRRDAVRDRHTQGPSTCSRSRARTMS